MYKKNGQKAVPEKTDKVSKAPIKAATKAPTKNDPKASQKERTKIAFNSIIKQPQAEEPVNKKLTTSSIFLILNKKDRNTETLKELVDVLKLEENVKNVNFKDPAIDGSFLHFLTATAQPNEEFSLIVLFKFRLTFFF